MMQQTLALTGLNRAHGQSVVFLVWQFGFQTWNMHMENLDTWFGWMCKTQRWYLALQQFWRTHKNMSPLRPWPRHGVWRSVTSSWSLLRVLYNVSTKLTCSNIERPEVICNVTASAPPLWVGFETPTTTHIEKIGRPKPGHFSDHPLWGLLLRDLTGASIPLMGIFELFNCRFRTSGAGLET